MKAFRTYSASMAAIIAFAAAACSMGPQAWAAQQAPSALTLTKPTALTQARLATFYGHDSESGRSFTLEPALIAERFPPYSTFKIPNFLIALDSGAVSNAEAMVRWDPERRPRGAHWPDDWARDHSLASAFRASAVWFFSDVATKVGRERYEEYLAGFGYGNRAVPDGSDDFWLGGSLAVSPREQVAFLRRLETGDLGVSPAAVDALRGASLMKEHGGYKLYGKTGAGPAEVGNFDGPFGGWLVGWVERPHAKPFYYAFYMQGADFRSVWRSRTPGTVELLKESSALPADWPK